MRKISILLLSVNLLGSAKQASAQAMGHNYKTAIGFKFYPTAFTIKHFFKPNLAIEGLGYVWRDGTRATALFEWHGPFKGAPGLKWYAGVGAHVDFWNDGYKRNRRRDDPYYNHRAASGVDGVFGLDYKFRGAPINLSLDWQPSVTFIGDHFVNPDWVGVAVRFAF